MDSAPMLYRRRQYDECSSILGIDSCPIEGFEKAKLEEILNLDTNQYQVAIVIPFGYRINPQSTQLREPFEEIVQFID